jgi:hypothetical protein
VDLVKPGEAALHDPALGAEPGAVVLTAPRDQGLDAAGPELAAVLVVVIAPVGEQSIGASARAAHLAGDRHDAIASVNRWCFEPARARSTGDGPVWSPPKAL